MFKKIPLAETIDIQGIREKIERIESESIFSTIDKALLILVLGGIKPATILGDSWPPSHDIVRIYEEGGGPSLTRERFDKEMNDKFNFIKNLGLAVEEYQQLEMDPNETGIELCHRLFYISLNPRLSHILKVAHTEKDHYRAGILLGFPRTAAKFYAQVPARERPKNEIPNEVMRQPYYSLMEFIPSPNNWQKEVETARKWADALSRLSPQIYREQCLGGDTPDVL